MSDLFGERKSVVFVEEGEVLAPRFEKGLLPVVSTDATTGEVLMVGVMNAEALARTLDSGEAHYWSRSRQCLWHKGETSGQTHKVMEMRIDDDQDALWLKVEVQGLGGSCHVGYRSCFYREVPLRSHSRPVRLRWREDKKVFDPKEVYAGVRNPTRL